MYSLFFARGISDEEVIQRAFRETRILITSDKDFGQKVYREHWPHHDIVLLRLRDERVSMKIAVLQQLLATHSARLPDRFVVVSEKRVRFAKEN